MLEITGRSVFTGEGLRLSVDRDRVVEISSTEAALDNSYISPGFFDLQVNGYRGFDYSAENLEPDTPERLTKLLGVSGTTHHLPTIITNPQQHIVKNLKVLARVLDDSPELSAAIPGMHIEGPYISIEDGPRGAHDAKYVRNPDFAEFEEWQQASGNRVRIVTLAPEKKGALEFIKRVSGQGVLTAIGHTAAPPERIREAVEAGARLSTHLGNGSHGLLPRLHNYLWEQLAEDRLSAGIIADGFHLPGSVLKVFARTKGLERLILVSDAAVPGGQAPGRYHWGDIEVEVGENGRIGLAGTEFLAGAGHLLDRDMAQFMRHTGLGLAETAPLCTINPSRAIGETSVTNNFHKGMPANLTLFQYRPGDERLDIEQTFFQGQTIYQRP